MDLVMDHHVQRACELLQCEIPAAKLIAVAESIAALAPVLWGHYQAEPVRALCLNWPSPTSADDLPKQQGANVSFPEPACAGDGSVGEVGVLG